MGNQDVDNLKSWIQRGEDSTAQFKRRFDSIDALAVEIAAMANSDGGTIGVGIEDDGTICGVERLTRLNQWISNACSQKIEPPLSVRTENVVGDRDGKTVVLIHVPLGVNKPYAVNRSERSEYWVKVGADKRRASREELRRLMQASGGLFADEMPVAQSGAADLDLYAFRSFYETQYGMPFEAAGIPLEKGLANLKLMQGENLTLAGLLLFGRFPERIKPQFVVKAVAFAGNDLGGSEYLDSEDIGGPLPVAFKNGMAFLKRNLRKEQKGRSFNLPGLLEIPEIALEEAYVNALIHRDYFIDSGVRLFVFDNRIEIVSPGRLPNTVTTENILHGIQMVRNPILMSFVGRLNIPYRGIGSGIIRMMKECREAGIPLPELEEDKGAELFRVTFKRNQETRGRN